MIRKYVSLLALSLLLFVTSALSATAAEITVYTALEDDELAVYIPAFEKQHPNIKLNLIRDSTGIITAKLLAEKDNPVADVVWGTAATSLLVANDMGMLAGYNPKGIEKVRNGMKDTRNQEARWVGVKAYVTGIVGNTIEMPAKNLRMPQSYADLIKPEYRGALVMPNPASSGTGFLTVSAILQLMGEEEGWRYLALPGQAASEHCHVYPFRVGPSQDGGQRGVSYRPLFCLSWF